MIRTPSRSARIPSLLLLGACAFLGCASEPKPEALPAEALHPVKGKVELADGKPLTEGEVTFVPVKTTSRAATGKLNADGTFTLKSGDQGEGAAEGQYKVKIESPLTAPGAKAGTQKKVVPPEYEDEDASQVVITIKSGPNDLPPIKLVPVKKGAAAKSKANLRDD